MTFALTPILTALPLSLASPAPAHAVGGVVDAPDEPRLGPPLVHGVALLTTMRAVEAWLWPDPFAETDLSVIAAHYREAWTKPPIFDPSRAPFEWDGDAWWLNGFGHGLLGSELYLRARACGFGVLGSFAWAAAGSATWEYVFEASGVRPSALDLVWTPVAGLAFGEARFQVLRAAGSIRDATLRVVVRAVIDPLGEIEHAITGRACGR